MRDAPINLRALPEQRDLIDYAASLLGKNRSDFMLEAACERAQAVVLNRTFFGLDSEKFKQFTELLDAPKVANAGLARLIVDGGVKAPPDGGARLSKSVNNRGGYVPPLLGDGHQNGSSMSRG
ncbi:uncharacterized protein (DUF1778 family) [Paraburkholderia sp. CI2]|uniref:type II toxin-antitoxin system TacA family antitoxin n=1 Tax=Paraburkholderia sp. CI2 TaxID=2723093 RepID=UPI0017B77F41|nr:DUF1778 domain-containing protein [Paraburkholderia sp. CI2]MBB5465944.1 uncharacterized protein (DUF1778 family) [Paraburkholderia sp. CI2]